MADKFIRALVEEVDEEALAKMPDWFKVLRKAYEEKVKIKI